MGERKVVNKFIPWDFDPDKACKVKLSNIGQFTVRNMLPFTVRCNACGEYMYAGKKFNTRKETVSGEDYLGIPIDRFYYKCTGCGSEFIIQTDPKNGDYKVVSGATRNTAICKNERQLELQDKQKQEEEENMDAMQALEERMEDSKREMDIYDTLDILQSQQRKTMNLDPENALELIRQKEKEKEKQEREERKEEDEEDEKELKEFLQKKKEEEEKAKDDKLSASFNFNQPKIKVMPVHQEKTKVLANGMKLALKKKKKTAPKKVTLGLVGY